jgi:hypothetical protein
MNRSPSLADLYRVECHKLTDGFLMLEAKLRSSVKAPSDALVEMSSPLRVSVRPDGGEDPVTSAASSVYEIHMSQRLRSAGASMPTITPQRSIEAVCDILQGTAGKSSLLTPHGSGHGWVLDLRRGFLGNWGTVALFRAMKAAADSGVAFPSPLRGLVLIDAGCRQEAVAAVCDFLATELGRSVEAVDFAQNEFLAVTTGVYLVCKVASMPHLRRVGLGGTNVPLHHCQRVDAVLAQHAIACL